MGIPSYFSYIINNYPNIVKKWDRLLADNVLIKYLFMDCNSIIYDEYRLLEEIIAKNNMEINEIENNLINNVIKKIGYYINLIGPSDLVYIAFDGVAPFAKMEQQRNRRHKGDIISKINSVSSKTPVLSKWSTSNITPGSNFMMNLSNKIKKAFSHTENHYKVKKIIVSGSTENGEGEHKMFKYIRDNKQNISGDCMIYGLDSDLIMLSLFHKTLFNNLFIFREAPEFGRNISNKEKDSENLFMNISLLANGILSEMNCDVYDSHRLYDYIFMCFFLGNDFLPHFPSLNIRTCGIDVLLDVYRKVIGKYSNKLLIAHNMNIQWRVVYLFVSELTKKENERFINESNTREKFSKRKWNINDDNNKDFMVQSVPVIYRFKEIYINPSSMGWENRYYKSLFSNGDNYNVKDICINYLEGLEWVFKYYIDDCFDWKWSYKYNYPPLLKDLCKFIPNKFHSFIKTKKDNAFSANVQLAYVLPIKNHYILPQSIREYIQENEQKYYPDEFSFEWSFCKYFWECHCVLPHIPLNILESWDRKWLV